MQTRQSASVPSPWRWSWQGAGRVRGSLSATQACQHRQRPLVCYWAVLVTCLTCALGLSFSRNALAAEGPKGSPRGKPQSVSVDLRRLGAELDLVAEESNRRRLATGLTGLGIGAAMVPSGLVLLGRTDGVARSLVIGMIIGGSAQIASAPLLLIPTRMDELRDTFRSRYRDADSKATVRALEEEWSLAADSSRQRRHYLGTGLLCFGATNLGAGLTLLLAPAGILGMSRKTQYTLGGVMMGVGVPTTTIGVRYLLEWSLEETSWQSYRTMKSDAEALRDLPTASISVVPTQGGASAVATLAF
jgi:hypothetical protein